MHIQMAISVCTIGHMYSLDAVDARIMLARDSSREASLIEISNRLGVSRNTVYARLKRLSEGGALSPPSSALAAAAIGRPLLAFVTLSVSQQEIDSVYAAIRAIPEVTEAHTTTGDADVMLRVVARDTIDLHRITQRIQLASGVQRSSTSIATTEVIPHRMDLLLHEMATAGS